MLQIAAYQGLSALAGMTLPARGAARRYLAVLGLAVVLLVSGIPVRETPALWWNADGFDLTPWRWMLWVMMVLVWVSAWRGQRYLLLVPAGMLLGLVSLLGGNLRTSKQTFSHTVRELLSEVGTLNASTVGYLAVAVAFVLLGARWWRSRRVGVKGWHTVPANGDDEPDKEPGDDTAGPVDQPRGWAKGLRSGAGDGG
jgi:hypothetical protein